MCASCTSTPKSTVVTECSTQASYVCSYLNHMIEMPEMRSTEQKQLASHLPRLLPTSVIDREVFRANIAAISSKQPIGSSVRLTVLGVLRWDSLPPPPSLISGNVCCAGVFRGAAQRPLISRSWCVCLKIELRQQWQPVIVADAVRLEFSGVGGTRELGLRCLLLALWCPYLPAPSLLASLASMALPGVSPQVDHHPYPLLWGGSALVIPSKGQCK